MSRVLCQTVWRVKPGLKQEFVRRWEAFAEWCDATGLGEHETLLRDLDRPDVFVSLAEPSPVGRGLPTAARSGYARQLARLGEVVEDIEAHAFERVAQRGGPL
jgi:hypothetical protein